MLANGSSRRMAAYHVGCAPSTITRTAARDPEFGDEVAHAECNAETEALALIRKAARKDRYWRAAAWLLERKNPGDFALRKPDALTLDQIRSLLASLSTFLLQDLPEEKYDQMMRRFDELSLEYPTEAAKPAAEPAAKPQANRMVVPEIAYENPSEDEGFATDPTEGLDGFGEGPLDKVDGSKGLALTSPDATETEP